LDPAAIAEAAAETAVANGANTQLAPGAPVHTKKKKTRKSKVRCLLCGYAYILPLIWMWDVGLHALRGAQDNGEQEEERQGHTGLTTSFKCKKCSETVQQLKASPQT
jgi:hypothetical protein